MKDGGEGNWNSNTLSRYLRLHIFSQMTKPLSWPTKMKSLKFYIRSRLNTTSRVYPPSRTALKGVGRPCLVHMFSDCSWLHVEYSFSLSVKVKISSFHYIICYLPKQLSIFLQIALWSHVEFSMVV